MSGNYSFIPIFHPLLIYRPMQVQILSKPFNSLHKRVLKTVLRKTITLTISDYNFLSILALKERLNYNKGVLIHSIMSRKVSPMAKFSLNQSRHSKKLNIPIRRIDHFKSGLEYCGSVLWNSLPNSLRLPSITKMFQSCYRPYVCYALTGCPCMLNLVIVVCLQRSDLLCFPFFMHLPISNVCCC